MKSSVFYVCYLPRYEREEHFAPTGIPFHERLLDYALEDGFDGVEFLPDERLLAEDGEAYARTLRDKMEKMGLSCPCFSVPAFLCEDPEGTRALLSRALSLAHAMGAKYFHHTFDCTLERDKIRPYEEVAPLFFEAARELAALAEPLGITCLYEPQGYYMNTVDRLSELLAAVDAPNVGICMDLSNPLYFDNDPLSFTQKFLHRIHHVHIKDCVVTDGIPEREAYQSFGGKYVMSVPLGSGIVDFPAHLRLLHEAGYTGYFSLEDTGVPTENGTREALDCFRRCYESVTASK